MGPEKLMEKDHSGVFVSLLTSSQSSVYAYICSLVFDSNVATDLLQETNLTLWRKRAEFEPGTNFAAWAYRVAYFKVLSYRRNLSRDMHLFDDELLDYLAERQSVRMEVGDRRHEALRGCMKKLSEPHRKLVQERYMTGGSVQVLAEKHGRTTAVISQTLYRIRCALLECIGAKLSMEY